MYSTIPISIWPIIEFIYTERSHVRFLKILILKFYEPWPVEYMNIRTELMPNIEEALELHSKFYLFVL